MKYYKISTETNEESYLAYPERYMLDRYLECNKEYITVKKIDEISLDEYNEHKEIHYYYVKVMYDVIVNGHIFQKTGRSGYFYAESYEALLEILRERKKNIREVWKIHEFHILEVTEEETKDEFCNYW